MFPNNGRYKTPGIDQTMGIELQLVLWQLIDERAASGETLDCLQVFELSSVKKRGQAIQQVLHRQEQPPYRQTIDIPGVSQPLHGVTVWVLDSGSYCTMLLPDEY